MSRLIVYAGPNGAGKSTLRDTGEGDAVDVVIDADQIARELAAQTQGDTNWDAGRLAIQRFYQALEQGKSLSLESTLTGQSVLKRMADAKNAEYVVELRYIALESAELHVLRVRGRVARGGHDISPEDIRRRYKRSLDNLPKALELADHAIVADNTSRAKQDLLQVRNRQVIFLHLDPPAWFQTRLPLILSALAPRAANVS